MNEFNCPFCKTPLTEIAGNQMHPGDAKYGVVLYCAAPKAVCEAAEVMGHGDKAKDAFEVIKSRHIKGTKGD
jgi:hypothetical protein